MIHSTITIILATTFLYSDSYPVYPGWVWAQVEGVQSPLIVNYVHELCSGLTCGNIRSGTPLWRGQKLTSSSCSDSAVIEWATNNTRARNGPAGPTDLPDGPSVWTSKLTYTGPALSMGGRQYAWSGSCSTINIGMEPSVDAGMTWVIKNNFTVDYDLTQAYLEYRNPARYTVSGWLASCWGYTECTAPDCGTAFEAQPWCSIGDTWGRSIGGKHLLCKGAPTGRYMLGDCRLRGVYIAGNLLKSAVSFPDGLSTATTSEPPGTSVPIGPVCQMPDLVEPEDRYQIGILLGVTPDQLDAAAQFNFRLSYDFSWWVNAPDVLPRYNGTTVWDIKSSSGSDVVVNDNYSVNWVTMCASIGSGLRPFPFTTATPCFGGFAMGSPLSCSHNMSIFMIDNCWIRNNPENGLKLIGLTCQ